MNLIIGMLLRQRSTLKKLSVTHITAHPHAGAQSSQPQSSAPSYGPEFFIGANSVAVTTDH